MIVVDASVFNKLYLAEDDSDIAQSLFEDIIQSGTEFGAPTLLLYEAVSPAIRTGTPVSDVRHLLYKLEAAGMRLMTPSVDCFALAERIAMSGNAASGHPNFYDAIYHAMAIDRAGQLVTADRKYFLKAQTFGSITMLDAIQTA